MTHLLDIRPPGVLVVNRFKGSIFENFVIANFQKFNENRYRHLNYYFWQDHNGLEIDLLLKTANAFDVYEVKPSQTLSSDLFKNLKHFMDLVEPRPVRLHLVYGGDEAMVRSDVRIVPWKMLEPLDGSFF